MDEPMYLNFDIQIEPRNGAYRARVVASPAGRGCCSEFDLASLGMPLKDGTPLPGIKSFGAQLFQTLFTGEIYSHLRLSQDEADRLGAEGLRIRLLLTDVPELAELPWEYLYDPTQDQFLSLSTKTPVIRYLDLSQRAPALAVKPPLCILVMISNPRDQPALDVDREWAKLSQALASLQAKGQVRLDLLQDATLPALQAKLRQAKYHVFHYIGHGGFDEQVQDGVLILEDQDGLSQPVNGQVLGTLLQDETSLRLALLNACEGAHGSSRDPFAGTAQSLVRKRVPAVIAMQTAISDDAARTFAYEFYRALADDYPVDAALTEARKAIFLAGNPNEWGTPVLFMRASDARLEEETDEQARAQPAPQTEAQPDRRPHLPRTVRLGRFAVPTMALILLPIVTVLSALFWVVGVGPSQMEGRFNVAIADAGVLDSEGQMHSTELSRQISRWIDDSVQRANEQSREASVTLWHDGLPLNQKRTRLGMIPGRTAQDRAEKAARLADKVNAHVVIYAHVTSDSQPQALILEFYVAPRVRIESAATIGRYQLGDPIPLPADLDPTDPLATESLVRRIQERAGLLYWLLLGLREDLLGSPTNELSILGQAEQELQTLHEQGEGKEHLYYFEGRAALFLDLYDEAEASLQKALVSDPDYARAQVALGSVYLDRAQTLERPEDRLSGSGNLERAIAAYQHGIDLAQQGNDPLTEIVGRLALAQAYRLEGETYAALDDREQASTRFDQAIQELLAVTSPLAAEGQHRLLAQAYASLGAAYAQQGQIAQIRGDLAGAQSRYRASVQAFTDCIAQGQQAPEDDILQTKIVDDPQNGCRHWQGAIQDILTGLPGG